MTNRLISLTSIVGLLLAVVGGWVYLTYFFNPAGGECAKKVVKESTSPSNTYVAEELHVSCSLSADSIQVIIKNTKTGSQQIVLSLKDDFVKSCNMSWDDDLSLKLSCDGNSEFVYNQRKKFEDVRINFYSNGKLNESNVVD